MRPSGGLFGPRTVQLEHVAGGCGDDDVPTESKGAVARRKLGFPTADRILFSKQSGRLRESVASAKVEIGRLLGPRTLRISNRMRGLLRGHHDGDRSPKT